MTPLMLSATPSSGLKPSSAPFVPFTADKSTAAFRSWRRDVGNALQAMLAQQCQADGGSNCAAITVTVASVTVVSNRRALMQNTAAVDMSTRTSGTTAATAEKVANSISKSGQLSENGQSYTASASSPSPSPGPTPQVGVVAPTPT